MSAVEDILLADSSQEAFAKLAPYDQALFCYRRFEFNHFGRLCRSAIDHHRHSTITGELIDGTDACLEQVKAGVAWHYKRYEAEQPAQDRADYAAAEDYVKGRADTYRFPPRFPPNSEKR